MCSCLRQLEILEQRLQTRLSIIVSDVLPAILGTVPNPKAIWNLCRRIINSWILAPLSIEGSIDRNGITYVTTRFGYCIRLIKDSLIEPAGITSQVNLLSICLIGGKCWSNPSTECSHSRCIGHWNVNARNGSTSQNSIAGHKDSDTKSSHTCTDKTKVIVFDIAHIITPWGIVFSRNGRDGKHRSCQ